MGTTGQHTGGRWAKQLEEQLSRNRPQDVKVVSNGSEMQISDVRFDQSKQALVIETAGQPEQGPDGPDYAKGLREDETAGQPEQGPDYAKGLREDETAGRR